ncbi:hemerythrin domain-containing protein [Salicibibacter cibarius]|uniref:Hemerythrin domain-containing protein n=1 Tax=Salicibibacter cibarius TaxID=2743000 RepID=A0A7T7CCB3_9BACI|nr:hemerythrin domain-containing protein [Salicibibacter cibarius]QQK76699.1 hemerythrin domain-containing protein [Salicibibacter cibarius]
MTEKRRRGVRRHEALFPLSHHHQNGLATALYLKRAGTEESEFSLDAIKGKLKLYWEEGGQQHFRDEEELLLPAFAKYDALQQPEISEMLIEHVQMRALVNQVLEATENEVDDMHQLGDILEKHIRKEERVIFPMIEKALPEEDLQALYPHFHQIDTPEEGVFFDKDRGTSQA